MEWAAVLVIYKTISLLVLCAAIDTIDYVHGIGNRKLTLYIRVRPQLIIAHEEPGCGSISMAYLWLLLSTQETMVRIISS
jgi:hypothetical protein